MICVPQKTCRKVFFWFKHIICIKKGGLNTWSASMFASFFPFFFPPVLFFFFTCSCCVSSFSSFSSSYFSYFSSLSSSCYSVSSCCFLPCLLSFGICLLLLLWLWNNNNTTSTTTTTKQQRSNQKNNNKTTTTTTKTNNKTTSCFGSPKGPPKTFAPKKGHADHVFNPSRRANLWSVPFWGGQKKAQIMCLNQKRFFLQNGRGMHIMCLNHPWSHLFFYFWALWRQTWFKHTICTIFAKNAYFCRKEKPRRSPV